MVLEILRNPILLRSPICLIRTILEEAFYKLNHNRYYKDNNSGDNVVSYISEVPVLNTCVI